MIFPETFDNNICILALSSGFEAFTMHTSKIDFMKLFLSGNAPLNREINFLTNLTIIL